MTVVNCGMCLVQAVCTALSVLACVPLGELFFFHMILIRKVGAGEFLSYWELWFSQDFWLNICYASYLFY